MEIEGGAEAGESAAAQSDIALLAVVEEIGGREEAGHRLDAAGSAVDGVGGILIALIAGGAGHQKQVPARPAAGDAEALRVDDVFLGLVTDGAQRPGAVGTC